MYTYMIYVGIVAYLILFFVFLTGLKIIKVKYKIHKTLGITGFITATVHGLVMFYYYFIQ